MFRRWVRLLFGREFSLQDLLVIWDALFADSITLDLVDYIFLAMLLYIRDACIDERTIPSMLAYSLQYRL
ncbi:TBC1 domain family member 5 [Varanus komodoensis]|nr:TBC1 domain family member 5 [Varanus komodoensis]